MKFLEDLKRRVNEFVKSNFDDSSLPLQKFFLVHSVSLFGLLILAMNGTLAEVYTADETRIVVVTFLIFLYGMYIAYTQLKNANDYRIQIRQAVLKNPEFFTNSKEETDVITKNLLDKMGMMKWINNTLVMMGLIGTVIGMVMIFDEMNLSNATQEDIASILSGLTRGLGVAFYTTLVGSILNVYYSFVVVRLIHFVDEIVKYRSYPNKA